MYEHVLNQTSRQKLTVQQFSQQRAMMSSTALC